jgi:hypothetical protein
MNKSVTLEYELVIAQVLCYRNVTEMPQVHYNEVC